MALDGDLDPVKLRESQQQSLGELFKALASDTGVLVRKEVELAKTEVAGKAKVVAKDGAMIAGGGVIAYYASFLLLAALVLALGTVMPLWASALLVGVVLAAVAGVLAFIGVKKLKKVEFAPRETIRTLEENKLWLREQMSR
jgi:hypothetical protein